MYLNHDEAVIRARQCQTKYTGYRCIRHLSCVAIDEESSQFAR
jgi:hypothetical protein